MEIKKAILTEMAPKPIGPYSQAIQAGPWVFCSGQIALDPKTGDLFDFVMFARTEGRFAKHFDKDGNPSPLLLEAKQDRLDNWRVLQELAGII